MRTRKSIPLLILIVFFLCFPADAQDGAFVEVSPEGIVKGVRQVRARFSEAMVPFGDPRAGAVEPFDVKCSKKGSARWADQRNWTYDFDADLPAGEACEFALKDGLRSLKGAELSGKRVFRFSTGGPSIIRSSPVEGSMAVNEDQIFVLVLDSPADEASVVANASFSVEGVFERVGIRIVSGKEREQILKTRPIYYYRQADKKEQDGRTLLIQARQTFPVNAKVSLVWGKGIATRGGVTLDADQALPFKTREPFNAVFHCERENRDAGCLPFAAMHLAFSAPVSLRQIKNKVFLKGADGKLYKAQSSDENEGDEEAPIAMAEQKGEVFVRAVEFMPPFPVEAKFKVLVAPSITDDSSRKLSNADKFPLDVRTDRYPPLVKFSSSFGIVESKPEAVLPVTLRNVEPEVKAGMMKMGRDRLFNGREQGGADDINGKTLKVAGAGANAATVLHWLRAIRESAYYHEQGEAGAAFRASRSIFSSVKKEELKQFTIPKPNGPKAFEVVGIPFKEPGFYVVEIESPLLGAALLNAKGPFYVPTAVLVTNMAVHFKRGREASLAWVTTLDKAEPVKGAQVEVRDCSGKLLSNGVTGEKGLVRMSDIPGRDEVLRCQSNGHEDSLIVSASFENDFSFVLSSWNQGIEPWRFGLYEGYTRKGQLMAHTIFDRTLLRAGETVHMKNILRRHSMYEFQIPAEERLPKYVVMEHQGTSQKYELPLLKWDENGVSEAVWEIPKEAKLGAYNVYLMSAPLKRDGQRETEPEDRYECLSCKGWHSGGFRVEEYRVPLSKSVIQMPLARQIAPPRVNVDVAVRYLAGGGAGGLPVKLRSRIQEGSMPYFEGYEGFVFANGRIKEGVVKSDNRGRYYEEDEEEADTLGQARPVVTTEDLTLDKSGGARAVILNIPAIKSPKTVFAELEYKDPNGEVKTASATAALWPSGRFVGLKADSWALSRDTLKIIAAMVDLDGKPVPETVVSVDIYERKRFSHRKRLVGGFYAYDGYEEIKKIGEFCKGKTDAKGLLFCEAASPVSGNVILQARAMDNGVELSANMEVWVAGKGEWWFDVKDSDRMDLIPEKKRYEPGEVARFQVRMPFREATVLVSIEREGVMDWFVTRLEGKAPVIEVPIKDFYSPNVYVSALAVRGRVGDVLPTALVDLARPSYKLGIAGINVGWRPHELKVKVETDKPVYRVRERAKVKIKAMTADNKPLPKGTEVAVAAVDEGLLELKPNESWKLLDAMMGTRGYEVSTYTAQTHVVGKRHFGLKALPHGGGGGASSARELFDTLLFWKGRVFLDEKGEAEVEVPLNDSITSFRIAAVANGGKGLFGTGASSMRTTQDVMLFSGIAPVVREGDAFISEFTVRNATERPMEVGVTVNVDGLSNRPSSTVQLQPLSPGEAREIGFQIKAPVGVGLLTYEVEAIEKGGAGGASDRMKVKQKVVPAVPVRTFQATLTQVDRPFELQVKRPEDALPGRGGINLILRPTLVDGALSGVKEYMSRYPYTCLEQKVSTAIALKDRTAWDSLMKILPAYIDKDGLLKYFPLMIHGSDSLTAYALAVSFEAGWPVPEAERERMLNGLRGFVNGTVIRHSSLPTADVAIRKIAAIDAMSRYGRFDASSLGSISIEPNLWPASAVIDWFNLLKREKGAPGRDLRLKEAESILRSRLNFQGTTMGFSSDGSDYLWWLMVSNDVNAVRFLISAMDVPSWGADMPRLVRGALARQKRGAWDLTVANAWGTLAIEKFSSAFEKTPVRGETTATLSEKALVKQWAGPVKREILRFEWPLQPSPLAVAHVGEGAPWLTVQSLAAIPLKAPFSSGYNIKKTLKPVQQRTPGQWSRGDIVRASLDIDAASDMTWVVVSDPVPSGAQILGSGLGGDSAFATQGERNKGWVWPAFEERSFEAFRSYYEFVPKGRFTVEYTYRLNQSGAFNLPETRVEAMYSPEMFGETPNAVFVVEREGKE